MDIQVVSLESIIPYKRNAKKHDKQLELEAQGHTVINPALLPQGLSHEKYMPICFQMLEAAVAIYMFNNWKNSKGALLEKSYAEYQRKEVLLDGE